MIELKQYIEESLLDDFDTLANNINPRDEIIRFLKTNYLNPYQNSLLVRNPMKMVYMK